MRIDLIEFIPMTLQRKEPFTIARGSSAISEVAFLSVHSGNRVGQGCAAPTDVTRENIHSALNAMQAFARSLMGLEFDRPAQIRDWADDAIAFARHVRGERVVIFEQPVPVDDWEGMRALTESSPIPIMADEMVLTADDAKKLRWANAARGVNLKLMKHGGIVPTAEVNTICESAGYPTMVGCMGEPQLSIAAALAFALAQKNVRWIDLDSHFNLAADPSSGLRFENGELVCPAGPGLGISMEWSR